MLSSTLPNNLNRGQSDQSFELNVYKHVIGKADRGVQLTAHEQVIGEHVSTLSAHADGGNGLQNHFIFEWNISKWVYSVKVDFWVKAIMMKIVVNCLEITLD